MSEPSFRHLLSTPRSGSARAGAAAWEAAFATCYVDLCEYVLRFVGSAPAAEDVVHDLFLQLWDTPDQAHLSRPYLDRKSTRLNSSHVAISYAVFCLKKKKETSQTPH